MKNDSYEVGATLARAMDVAESRGMNDSEGFALFKADDHQRGPGKVHLIPQDEYDRMRCGKPLIGTAGSLLPGTVEDVTCRGCLSGIESDQRQDEWRAQWEQKQLERDAENAQWWAWYNDYLESPEWHHRRRRVLDRCRGICEGCGTARAVHVHHLTYARAGREMLFDLVGVCADCHETIHDRDIAR